MNDGAPEWFAKPWLDYLCSEGDRCEAWHVISRLRSTVPQGHWLHLVEGIGGLSPTGPDMTFYRAIFLLRMTHQAQWAYAAGHALSSWPDCSKERILTFVFFIWSQAIYHSPGRDSFRALLEAANVFPLLAECWAPAGRGLPAKRQYPVNIRAADATPVLNKVAVVSPLLTDFNHAGTQLALEHAAMLSGAGLTVEVFATQDNVSVGVAPWLGFPWEVICGEGDRTLWRPVSTAARFRVHTASARLPHRTRWADILHQLDTFVPDVVLFVGFFSPLLNAIAARYPVVGLSLHTQPPMAPIDVWLHPFEAGQPISPPWPGQPDYILREYLYRVATSPIPHVSLAPLQLPAGAPVVVTAGVRLSDEIRPDWARQVLQKLENHPDWIWLLIGAEREIPGLPQSDRIRRIPIQTHFSGILAQCQLYLNPARMGGGFSVLQAMSVALPVISLADSDGGNKLGPYAAVSDTDYWTQLDKLLADASLRRQVGAELLARFSRHYDLRHALPALMAGLKEGQRHFHDRIRRP